MFEELSQSSPLEQTLLWLKENHFTHYEELVFFPSYRHLKASVRRTMAYHSMNDEELANFLSSFHLVARTIDGDYILANDETVCLFPRSHQKEEIQQYNGSFADLLIRYANSSKSITDFFDFTMDMTKDQQID